MESRRLTEGDLCEGHNCTNRAAYVVHDRMGERLLLLCVECEKELSRQTDSWYDHKCPNCGCMQYIN